MAIAVAVFLLQCLTIQTLLSQSERIAALEQHAKLTADESISSTSILNKHSEDAIPTNTDKEYTYGLTFIISDDFESKFDVTPLHHVLFDPDLEHALDEKDVHEDGWYKSDPLEKDRLAVLYGPFIAEGSHEQRDRERYFIKWSSQELGYGLFAKVFIAKGEVIGLYTGITAARGVYQNTDYMWYPLDLFRIYGTSAGTPGFDSGELDVGIDSRRLGNYLRFTNHANTIDARNVKSEYVPYNNRWYIVYVAIQDIQPGCEIFTR